MATPLGLSQSIDGSIDGAFIIERAGTDLEDVMSKLEPKWRDNIHVIHQVTERGSTRLFTVKANKFQLQQIRNDVSSTKIRTFLRKDLSIRYLVPEPVRYLSW
jgi:nicotinamide mononucleotide adenylyltransferase